MKLTNRKRIEELEKVCKPGKERSSYALVIYSAEISDQIDELEIDADFVVALPDNGRDDLRACLISKVQSIFRFF